MLKWLRSRVEIVKYVDGQGQGFARIQSETSRFANDLFCSKRKRKKRA